MTVSPIPQKRIGLSYWMHEVLEQSEKASGTVGSGPVHDLRTALRRCRSMADGIMVFDRHSEWKKMKRAGKQLFSSLGELRDTHVIKEWVEKLAPEGDAAGKKLIDYLAGQEEKAAKTAATALQGFDRKQWKAWADELPARAADIPLDAPVFAHLALERWEEARALHIRALRNRTNVAFHELRIGLKRLRYTVENFLPSLHQACGQDLKELQDLLGDVHDLDVLWKMAIDIKAYADTETRTRWRSRVEQERGQRLDAYRKKMVGSSSLWQVWRSLLPRPDELRTIGLERLQIWASFLDPSVSHTAHIAQLATQLYDGLPFEGILGNRIPHRQRTDYRTILQAAAYMHDVGLSRVNKGHHKVSARLIRRLDPPLGWTAGEMSMAAVVARYHRGALPRETQKSFAALSPSKQRLLQFLAGVLRLACACDQQHDNQIQRIEVQTSTPVLTIRAKGYSEFSALAEHLAAARHLLEAAYHRPIFILPLEAGNQAHAA
jgi:CHAD domain-containing protein